MMKHVHAFSLALLFSMLFISTGWAQAKAADDIVGTWRTSHKDAQISIYKSGSKYYGKILTGSSKQKTDIHNPDKARRNDPLIGLVILKDFKFDGDDEWEDGKIYDPSSGKTYSCVITLPSKNTLKVRGYVGISWVGRTEVWSRVN